MAENTDKFRKTFAGPATTLTEAIGTSDTSIPLDSVSGWPTDTAIDIVIDRVDSNGESTPQKKEVVTIVVEGNRGINAIRGVGGLAQPHSEGAVVEPSIVSAKAHNDMVDGIRRSHKQNGGLEEGVVDDSNIVPESSTRMFPKQFADRIESGLVVSVISGTRFSISSGVYWIDGTRYVFDDPVNEHTFTANVDVAIDIDKDKSLSYIEAGRGELPDEEDGKLRIWSASLDTSETSGIAWEKRGNTAPVSTSEIAGESVTNDKLAEKSVSLKNMDFAALGLETFIGKNGNRFVDGQWAVILTLDISSFPNGTRFRVDAVVNAQGTSGAGRAGVRIQSNGNQVFQNVASGQYGAAPTLDVITKSDSIDTIDIYGYKNSGMSAYMAAIIQGLMV